MVVLSVLWCLCSLPILTLGASSAALYHTAVKVIRQNRGYAFATFRDSFKGSLRQTFPFTVLLVLVYVLFGATCYVCWQNPDSIIAGIYVFFSVFSILVCLAAQIHGFALSGRFRLNRRELFTLIVRLTFRHPFKNFLLICIFVLLWSWRFIIRLFCSSFLRAPSGSPLSYRSLCSKSTSIMKRIMISLRFKWKKPAPRRLFLILSRRLYG